MPDKPRIRVDFNEMVEQDLVLLSKTDTCVDSSGQVIELYEGKRVLLYMEDLNENNQPDPLLAAGIVERNRAQDWSSHVPWCCRIDQNGVHPASEYPTTDT